jgi:hypothetical protein
VTVWTYVAGGPTSRRTPLRVGKPLRVEVFGARWGGQVIVLRRAGR